MKNLLIVGITMLMFTSCTHDTFKVIKYSDSNSENGDYYSFISTKEEYYVAKHNDFYYIKSDTIVHFEKVTYLGRGNCYEKTIVKDDDGKQYMLNAYYDESTVEDEFVFIIIIDIDKQKEVYSFVLDWKSRNKNIPAESRIANAS